MNNLTKEELKQFIDFIQRPTDPVEIKALRKKEKLLQYINLRMPIYG